MPRNAAMGCWSCRFRWPRPDAAAPWPPRIAAPGQCGARLLYLCDQVRLLALQRLERALHVGLQRRPWEIPRDRNMTLKCGRGESVFSPAGEHRLVAGHVRTKLLTDTLEWCPHGGGQR